MPARLRCTVFAVLAGALAGTLPAQAQPYPAGSSAPLVPLPQSMPTQPVYGPEAGPSVELPPPIDPMPGVTVDQAGTRGVSLQQDSPGIASVPRP